MARVNNLSNFLTDVASAIKTKKGSETAIPAANFDTEILALPSQGVYQTKVITINENGQTVITPDSGYDAMDGVQVTTLIPEKQLQTKSYNFTTNQTIELSPDTGYDGFDSVVLTINVPVGEDLSAELIEQEEIIARLKTELENKAGKPVKPNIFCQSTEPSKKDGIWLQTDKEIETILQVDSVPTERQADTSPKPNMIYMQEYYAAYYNNAIYIFGSYNALKIAKYDLTNQTVSEISPGITASNFSIFGRLGDSIYFRKIDGSYSYLYEFNLETEQTISITNSLKFDSSLYTTDGTYIYGVGTSTGSGSGTIYKYDLTNSTKTTLGSLPVAFYNGAVVCKGNYIYCFGGNNTTSNYTYKFNMLDGTTTQLTEWSSTNPSSGARITSSSEDIFIAQYPKIYIYNIATDTFTTYDTNGTVYAPVYVEPQGKLYYFNYSTIYAVYDKVTGYPDNSLIITKGSREHSAKLFNCELFQNGFVYDFGDAYIYTIADGLDRTIPTYCGNGTQWVKFKN